jgi:hypothetical protein
MFQNQKERQRMCDDGSSSQMDENTFNSTLYGSSYVTISWIDDRCKEIKNSLKNDFQECISDIRDLGAERLFYICDTYSNLIDSDIPLIHIIDEVECLSTITAEVPVCDSLEDVKIIMYLRDFKYNGNDPVELSDKYPDVMLQDSFMSDDEVKAKILEGLGSYNEKDIIGIQVMRDLQTRYEIDICDFIDHYSDLILSNKPLLLDGKIVTDSLEVRICDSIEDAHDILLLRKVRILKKSIQIIDYCDSSSKEKGRMVGKIEHHVREHLSGRIDHAYNDIASSDMCVRMGGLKNVR